MLSSARLPDEAMPRATESAAGPSLALDGGVLPPPGNTDDAVQHMRAIACWLVVAFHLGASLNTEFGWTNHAALGAIGVDVFFVVSGYIMAMIVSRGASFSPTGFLLRRAARVVPLYWLVTLGLFAVSLTFPALFNRNIAFSNVFFSMMFVPDPIIDTAIPALSVGWTLNYEVFFYGIVAMTVGLSGDRSLMSTALVLTLLVIAGLLVGDGGTVFNFFSQPILLEFVFGIVIWRYGRLITGKRWFDPVWCLAMPFVMVLLAISGVYDDTWRFFLWGVPAALFFLGGQKLFSNPLPWLSRLGDWSFSTYLLHICFIQFFVKIALDRSGGSPALVAGGILLVLVCTVAGSALLYRLFERPVTVSLTRWLERLPLSKPRTAASPLVNLP